MIKRIFTDPSFIFLIAINVYCIWYYQNNPDQFFTLVFLYWGQSLLIGIFNFADLLTLKSSIWGSVKDPSIANSPAKGCTAAFFALHYGMFHFVYGIFILVQAKLTIDFRFVLLGLAAFSLNLLLQFIRQKQWEQENIVNAATIFFLPYLRIIPMHLMLIGPAFLHWQPSIIFLVLKAFADATMYLATSPVYKPGKAG